MQDVAELEKCLAKANERIVELADHVNFHAIARGLGRKIHAEDWTIEPARAARD